MYSYFMFIVLSLFRHVMAHNIKVYKGWLTTKAVNKICSPSSSILIKVRLNWVLWLGLDYSGGLQLLL